MRVAQELEETKIILVGSHKTIESVTQRSNNLETFMNRSDHLYTQSKMFYQTAKKQNSNCCVVISSGVKSSHLLILLGAFGLHI
ncbi:hypothetical protein B0H17DRAFT_1214754 [Mycena rosella]|uniref:V-SNARE coiled-coil homology domain-containing protein n=1 Tax=Mycena rosella TaxID=1033263 RepID=A0AAD7CMC0_MYCRO|nr:hypothetical protein B0H17DRAFT_1214754 [Mycena rosella]